MAAHAGQARQRFLSAVEARLPLPADERREVLEEISSHLDDAVAELEAGGHSVAEAERLAQARLGAASTLADELTRARQSPRRLLEAAGVALRVAIGDGLAGLIIGWACIFILSMAAVAIVQVAGDLTGNGWRLMFDDQGWNSMLTGFAGWIAAYQVGRRLPPAVAIASRHREEQVRPWTLGLGTILAVSLSVFVIEQPQNWASVVVWSLVAPAFVLGTLRRDLLPGSIGRGGVALVALVGVVTLSIGLLLATGPVVRENFGAMATELPGPPDYGYDVVGRSWPRADEASVSTSKRGGLRRVSVVELSADARRLHDLRLEAWPIDGPPSQMRISGGGNTPFSVAPAAFEDGIAVGTIQVDKRPAFTYYALFLVGVDEAGTRYRLASSCCDTATFHGSVWDWMVAVVTEG
jgi:hypothetical protein